MSKIQWTDQTANPIKEATGGNYCIPCSPGCQNCYASALNANPFFDGNGRRFGVRPSGHPEMILKAEMIVKWARMRKARRIFVGSMTDVFGEWVTDVQIWNLWEAMAKAPKQTFQMLTKRPERITHMQDNFLLWNGLDKFPPNIWIGTSAEDQQRLDERLIWLIRSKAQIRFLSLEPLLGPLLLFDVDGVAAQGMAVDSERPVLYPADMIDWIIVGGESGPNARPLDLAWIEDIIDQCRQANIPVFVKQLGSVWAASVDATDRKGGDPDEWPEQFRIRMMPGEEWAI